MFWGPRIRNAVVSISVYVPLGPLWILVLFRSDNELVRAGCGLLSLVPAILVLWGHQGRTAITVSPSKNGDTIVPESSEYFNS